MLDIVDIKKEDIGKKLSICGWIKNHLILVLLL